MSTFQDLMVIGLCWVGIASCTLYAGISMLIDYLDNE